MKDVKNVALKTAGTIFGLVSVAHWVRYFREAEAIVGGYTVPVSLSLALGIIVLMLSIWMFAAARD